MRENIPTDPSAAPAPPALTFEAVPSLRDVEPAAWNACARAAVSPAADALPAGAEIHPAYQETADNPFVLHEFLSALEESGSAVPRTGWAGAHLIARDADGTMIGAVPAYLKTHSRGEYVFDQGWAEAYEAAGGRYYPKLQVSVPFTPCTGPRLMVRPGRDAPTVRRRLAGALAALARQTGASSVHVTFPTGREWAELGEAGWLQRTDRQFQWTNRGYTSFEAFLEDLTARKRKAIRRERREGLASGIEICRLTGSDLTEEVWDAFFACYMDTGSRKWGRPYLTRDFFSLVSARMADTIVLAMARRGGRWIAGALNFRGSDTLYGRHWGAIEHHPFLHFELCYYQAIEAAIELGLARVEAGAQGEHKLARGYLPVPTYSAHYIADPALRRGIASYLARERAYVADLGRTLLAETPFRKDPAAREKGLADEEFEE
ncbi:GNAT family N-acetyltransferase [Blastochloris sulfoviridis]|uniref:N-acetyltransferase n=1 Tax=Blastochloris sulfoviridis TaxID=50712 RepID=A0A5M6HTL1_9HYPH|nr:GNAT family N-acetyltransferase [Blastochloris sulfoviridis]KAA5598997.1 N-acetyltransferase [Blastochloris sulfoviridis]